MEFYTVTVKENQTSVKTMDKLFITSGRDKPNHKVRKEKVIQRMCSVHNTRNSTYPCRLRSIGKRIFYFEN